MDKQREFWIKVAFPLDLMRRRDPDITVKLVFALVFEGVEYEKDITKFLRDNYPTIFASKKRKHRATNEALNRLLERKYIVRTGNRFVPNFPMFKEKNIPGFAFPTGNTAPLIPLDKMERLEDEDERIWREIVAEDKEKARAEKISKEIDELLKDLG